VPLLPLPALTRQRLITTISDISDLLHLASRESHSNWGELDISFEITFLWQNTQCIDFRLFASAFSRAWVLINDVAVSAAWPKPHYQPIYAITACSNLLSQQMRSHRTGARAALFTCSHARALVNFSSHLLLCAIPRASFWYAYVWSAQYSVSIASARIIGIRPLRYLSFASSVSIAQ
jgi:hypothetical protein